MANVRRTFKAKSVPDDFLARMTAAIENFELKAKAAQLSPDHHQRLRAFINEWVMKSVEMQILGVTPTKRDYRLFMLRRLELY